MFFISSLRNLFQPQAKPVIIEDDEPIRGDIYLAELLRQLDEEDDTANFDIEQDLLDD